MTELGSITDGRPGPARQSGIPLMSSSAAMRRRSRFCRAQDSRSALRACACRGLETQVLRAEYRGPETRGPETQCPFIEVLDSGPEAATLAFIALRYVKTRRQQQKNRVAKNSRQHFNGIMSSSAATRRRSRFCRAWARDSQSALRAPVEVLKPRS